MSFDRELVDRAPLFDVHGHPDELSGDQFNLWDGEADVHEDFEGDAYFVTVCFRTPDSALELTVHEVDYDGLRSLQMSFPALNAGFFVIFPV